MEKEQIIKALECCANGSYDACAQCPLHDGSSSLIEECMEGLIEQALSRIREQEKRIEELETSCTELTQNLHACKADTVRKMQEKLKTVFDSESKFVTQTHGNIRYIVDEIAKGILEETK